MCLFAHNLKSCEFSPLELLLGTRQYLARVEHRLAVLVGGHARREESCQVVVRRSGRQDYVTLLVVGGREATVGQDVWRILV